MERRLETLIERSAGWVKADRGEDLPALVTPLLQELFRVDGGFFLYLHELLDADRVRVHGAFGVNDGEDVLLQQMVERGKWFYRLPHLIPLSQWVSVDEFPTEWARYCKGLGLTVAGVWPIEMRERVGGAMILSKHTMPDNAAEESRLLQLFTTQLSIMLTLLVDKRDAELSSQVDPLTGLSNRRGFMTSWSQWQGLHRSQGDTIAIGILDVDGFKEVNDLRGHWIGDQILQDIALNLRAVIGESDLCARWGGDEFVFVKAERREGNAIVQDLSMHMRDALPNVSFGIALLGEDGDDFDSCLVVADQRMYKSKSERTAIHKVRSKRRVDFAES